MLSKDLDEASTQLLSDIIRFQDKMFAKDPTKAKSKKRYVVGLREVKKFLTVKKVCLLLLAPDIERSEGQGGLNDVIGELLALASSNETPVAFVLNRRRLGKACLRTVPVSCVGVMNHQGSEVQDITLIMRKTA